MYMSPEESFSPIGKLVSARQQLELSLYDQMDLLADLKNTERDLAARTDILPTLRELTVGRIALRSIHHQAKQHDTLLVQYSETNDQRRSATISFTEDTTLTQFKLSHTDDRWNVYMVGDTLPRQNISNEQVVSILYPKLRQHNVLTPLMDDANYHSIIIARILAMSLKKYANRFMEKTIYDVSTPFIGADDYITSVANRFKVINNNGRNEHHISIKSPFALGTTTVEKEYHYFAESSPSKFYDSAGTITMTSSDGYTKQELANFAKHDSSRNEPLYSLHKGLQTIRREYGLDDASAATA